MICPSCSNVADSAEKYCSRCGLALTTRSQKLLSAAGTFSWIMRRALGGMFAGIIGWMLSIALNRVMSMDTAPSLTVELLVRFAIVGTFLGNVGGIIERSSYKALLGGVLGCIGGIIGGLINRPVYDLFANSTSAYSISHLISWGVVGLFVGMTSGLIERNRKKIIAGLVAGIVGGSIGGILGSTLYAGLLMDPSRSSWLTFRFIEASAGAVVGINLWLVLGLVEKLYIFRRKQISAGSEKVCDFCHTQNSLRAWYCKNCGRTLQFAASVEKLKITPYRALERISNAFKFLSWLFAVAGIVIVVIIFISLLFQNILFAIFVSVALAIAIYIISVVLNGISEMLVKFMKIKESE